MTKSTENWTSQPAENKTHHPQEKRQYNKGYQGGWEIAAQAVGQSVALRLVACLLACLVNARSNQKTHFCQHPGGRGQAVAEGSCDSLPAPPLAVDKNCCFCLLAGLPACLLAC